MRLSGALNSSAVRRGRRMSAILRNEWQPYRVNVSMDQLPPEEDCAKAEKAVEKVAIRLFPESRVVRVKVEARSAL